MKNIIPHNKLVRDKIPEIIEKSGKTAVCRLLSDEEYLEMLDRKLSEELDEYLKDQSMEEIADLLEVIYAVIKARGASMEEVEKIRLLKKEKRGGFENKVFLKCVVEE